MDEVRIPNASAMLDASSQVKSCSSLERRRGAHLPLSGREPVGG